MMLERYKGNKVTKIIFSFCAVFIANFDAVIDSLQINGPVSIW